MSSSPVASLPLAVAEPHHSERIVEALDLQGVGEGPDRWLVHVLGVHTDGRDVWVQIARHVDGTDSLVLRLSRRASPRHALAALAVLPPAGIGVFEVVPVMCVCQ